MRGSRAESPDGGALEKVREMLEREWGRQEVLVRERLQDILSETHTPAGEYTHSDTH